MPRGGKTSGSFKPGHAPTKPKGALNKTTKDIKEAYRLLIEKNLDNMTTWLEKIAKKDPAKAIYIISELSEYVVPKLARTELTGKDGEKLKIELPQIIIERRKN